MAGEASGGFITRREPLHPDSLPRLTIQELSTGGRTMPELNTMNYVAIPISTLLSEEWKVLQATSRCVFLAMISRYQEDSARVAWSSEDLALASGVSLRTIRRCIWDLRTDGFISILNQGGRWRSETEYELNLEHFYANVDPEQLQQKAQKEEGEIKLPPGDGVIYFIGNSEFGIVKIGYTSRDTDARLKCLQTACPYELCILKLINKSSQRGEANLHRHFAEYKLQGEWFALKDDLVKYLEI